MMTTSDNDSNNITGNADNDDNMFTANSNTHMNSINDNLHDYCSEKFILIIFSSVKVTCVIIKFVLFVLCVNNLLSSTFKFSTKLTVSNQVMLFTIYQVL